MATFEFLGRLSDIQKLQEILPIPSSVTTVQQMRVWLSDYYQTDQLSCPSVRVVINDVIVTNVHSVSNLDRIAFLPPVGGG